MVDCLVRGGRVVEASGVRVADIRIADGRIVEIAPELSGVGAHDIDARGLVVMPAVFDVHVHFNEPGRTEWEGGRTGSHALAAGGGAAFVDMPLNSTPCVVTAHECIRKREALEVSSVADFGLWGGLVPGHIDDMPGMAAQGVMGFKAFMCDSGLPEFPRADARTLKVGLAMAASLGLPVAVHAEDEAIVRAAALQVPGHDARSFLASRPLAAELAAIDEAVALAGETGAALHIVHVSSGAGVRRVAEARARGADVSIETCPHYLAFVDADLERLGVVAKCAPPLRSAAEQAALWAAIAGGDVDVVASDHSPSPPTMKVAGDFVASWGGIAGVQSTLGVLLSAGVHERGLPLERVAALVAGTPARRFRISSKGAIALGRDADLVVVDLAARQTLARESLQQRHPISPYVGMMFNGAVRRTLRRGETIFVDGRVVAGGGGRMLRPDPERGTAWRM